MTFDFTPDPKVLIALTHTPMRPIDALCELIDNAIDSFYIGKLQGRPTDSPVIVISLPTKKQLNNGTGCLRIQDNGPGMTADVAEKAIKAGYSGNNPYDTLGLFGMGFNISTGKLGNRTVFRTTRSDMNTFIQTIINLTEINTKKNYSLPVEELPKNGDPFDASAHGTIIEISDWWPEGNQNSKCIQSLVQYGIPTIRREIGRRYASILRAGEIRIIVNEEKCEPFEHCIWDDSRFVTRKNGQVPAVIRLDHVVGTTKRCGSCTAILGSDDYVCPACGSTVVRTIEERIKGWVGIQRFDSETAYGIDLIRNGRAIRVGEKAAFFEYTDELNHVIKDYPIDSIYGRIVGEVHLDFVPVDFQKQDFQRSSLEWQKAMRFLRGESSLQPTQPNADKNQSPIFKLFQGYRRVRQIGRGDMYMGFWDADSRAAKRISRDTEKEYYEKFLQKLPGYYDDSEWWKLVETADQPPVDELPECPECGAQNLKEAETCGACGCILKGKICINPDCAQPIPQSAVTCPICGGSQQSIILEPWICKVCQKKNLAANETCVHCGSVKGTPHPLSLEVLMSVSVKDDELSSERISLRLADGFMSNPLKVSVYASSKPMIVPSSKIAVPMVVKKELGHLTVFFDAGHPVFSKCNMSKKQMLASEIAQYMYAEKQNLANNSEHTISNLTWQILQECWKDTIELSTDTIYKAVSTLLNDILQKTKDIILADAAYYFDELSPAQKKVLTENLIRKGVNLADISTMRTDGSYIDYVPFSFIQNVFRENPDIFFGGGIWGTSLASGGEELLGLENVASARDKIISQYRNYLDDVITFAENKYSDPLTLQRVELSISFLQKGMVS